MNKIPAVDHLVIDVAPLLDWVRGDGHFYVGLVYQPAIERWLALCGTPEFRLLSDAVVVSLLGEAFRKGLGVFANRNGMLVPLAVTGQ